MSIILLSGSEQRIEGNERPINGYHTLPDSSLTPLHIIMAMIVAHDDTIYATTISPFTLLRSIRSKP